MWLSGVPHVIMYQIPEGFGCVEDGVWRVMTIHEVNLIFLDTLALQTVLFLNAETPSGSLIAFCASKGINLIHSGLQPWRPLSDLKLAGKGYIQHALSVALNKNNYPVLVVDSSNLFIGVLRRIQHWSYTSVLSEYTSIAGARSSYNVEVFLEMIKPVVHHAEDEVEEPAEHSVVLPPRDQLPDWFLFQEKKWKELNGS